MHLVAPAGLDDPRSPSGGNRYDRQVCRGLRAGGRTVCEHLVAGAWPTPTPDERAALARVLSALPDRALVLLDGLVACGVPEVVVPEAARLRLVVLVHLPLGDEVGASAGLTEREGRTLRAARGVVATSPWAARRLLDVHGLGDVHVAAPGVDPAPPALGTVGGGRLLCVGALTSTKGQDLLVEALHELAPELDRGLPGRWRCDLVGPLDRDPGFTDSIVRALARSGLNDRVRLAGPLTGEALAAAYAAADLLVLPSRAETYGMVLTEALARGIPVLAAAVGGVPETVGAAPDGEVPGLLVSPGDVPALAAGLRRWFDEPRLRTRLRAAAGRRRGTLSGWEVTTRCLARVLDRPS